MTRPALQQRVLRFIEEGGDFEALALALHRHQFAHDPIIRALCAAPAASLPAIPAVPVGLFRELDVGTVEPEEPHQAFHTSGTTVGRPGVHRVRDTVLYDAGCLAWAQRWLPDTRATIGLMAESGHSSLAHMVRLFAPHTGPVQFLLRDEDLDLAPLARVEEPVFICATSFALDLWLSSAPAALPAGSAIMVTGGFKGRSHSLDADALIQAAQRLAPVLLEYGMTELSSQLWARPGEPYAPPPWLRVQAVDPLTGATLPAEQPGQLRFMDLCNLDSTVHIETLDQGIVHADGRVSLLGRLPDAPARGCSLAVEDLL